LLSIGISPDCPTIQQSTISTIDTKIKNVPKLIVSSALTMKLNGGAVSSSSNWVDQNKASVMVCEITQSDDALAEPPQWFKSSTKVRHNIKCSIVYILDD
jgi:hypothetical protein